VIQAHWVPALQRHLNALQVGVHADIDTCDGALHNGAILELDGHRLVCELHQKANELHPALLCRYWGCLPYVLLVQPETLVNKETPLVRMRALPTKLQHLQ